MNNPRVRAKKELSRRIEKYGACKFIRGGSSGT